MKKYLALLFLLMSATTHADSWKASVEALDQVYAVDNMRLFYTLHGTDALPALAQTDLNKNSVPDYVEKLAEQLKVANNLYSKVLGFEYPLNGSRYRNVVQGIDIHVRQLNGNGTSGDRIIAFKYVNVSGAPDNVLSMELSNRLNDGNLTPAHELFHAYQNGYTLFKNRWYTEGTARWAEFAFNNGTGPEKVLPGKVSELNTLLLEDYDAKYFWNRLLSLCDTDGGRFSLPAKLPNQVYPINFVKDDRLNGYSFMRFLLEQFQRMDKKAALDRGLKSDDWPEQEQKSDANNPYLLCAIKQTITQQCPQYDSKKELKNFIRVVDQYVNGNCPA